MKIENSYKSPTTAVTPRAQPKTPTPAASTAAEVVNLSRQISAQTLNEKPPVNTIRVQEIRDAIAQGKFKINPEAIAGRLIETARDLINSQRRV